MFVCECLLETLLFWFFWVHNLEWNFWVILVILYWLFREPPNCFPPQCTISHSYQEHTSVPISSCLHQHLLFFLFFPSSHSNGCNVGFMCISLMSSDIEHLIMCSLVIDVSSLEKCLFKPFVYFWKELLEESARSWDRQTPSIRVLSTQSIWWQGTDTDSPKVTI